MVIVARLLTPDTELVRRNRNKKDLYLGENQIVFRLVDYLYQLDLTYIAD